MSLPDQVFVRRGEAKDYLGVTDQVFTDLVKAKVLDPFYPRGQGRGRALYYRSQVLALGERYKKENPNGK